MPVNPTLPTPGASNDTWGQTLNTAIQQLATLANALEAGRADTVLSNVDVTAARAALGLGAAALLGVGSSAGTVAAGNDSRLSDARVPTAHASTHASAGSDPVAVAQSQVAGLTTALTGKAASDLSNVTASTGRTALGLGGAAVLNVGTSTGSVAAGDDARFTIASNGAEMYRASTGVTDTASGSRTMAGYDTTRYADSGWTVSQGSGTITVPADGFYVCEAHARFSTNFTSGFAQITVNDGTNDIILGHQGGSVSTVPILDLSCAGFVKLTAATVLRARVFSSASASLVGSAAGNLYYFRVVRL